MKKLVKLIACACVLALSPATASAGGFASNPAVDHWCAFYNPGHWGSWPMIACWAQVLF